MTDSDEVKLLPCPDPWCEDQSPRWTRRASGRCRASCGCGIEAPWADTPEGAIAAWNTRPPVVTDEVVERPKGLHATLTWEPYSHWDLTGEGGKREGFRRSDGMGYVLPEGERWWVTWYHDLANSPGWHHHAFGSYVSAEAGAMAFDMVYELERIAGSVDRMSREDRAAIASMPAVVSGGQT